MSHISRIRLALKALRELGPKQVGLYAWYQLGLRSGYYKRTMKAGGKKPRTQRQPLHIHQFLELPDKSELTGLLGDAGIKSLLAEADEIVAGKVRLFGGPPAPLRLKPHEPLFHWTAYELGHTIDESEDVKFIWEPGRFGWALTLARAYYLSENEVYAETFWNFTDTFLEANPPNMGPQWVSAQEVALRIMALAFSWQVFMGSSCSTPGRLSRLAEALAEHAERIPPPLVYARAQNNNHLVSEAIGLYTAGVLLCDHPDSARWRDSGWYWFNQAMQTQIADDGTYIQHSTNYHRLVLQAALWINCLASYQGADLPPETIHSLSIATRWLANLLDPDTGGVPNLGPNDGANILPLTVCKIEDYRPVLQAAYLAFCGERLFEHGLWGELGMWLQVANSRSDVLPSRYEYDHHYPHVLRSTNSWAYLRAADFTSRPGHADQLHLDLWWRGLNVAPDPGTYLYNASEPWDNALTRTDVHNTLTVNGRDQMTHAGRFLWLDWAQGKLVSHARAKDRSWESITAQHNGYRQLNATHQREVVAYKDDRWMIEDRLIPSVEVERESTELPTGVERDSLGHRKFNLSLHWLLPDWDWAVENEDGGVEIRLESPFGPVHLSVKHKEKLLPQQPTYPLKAQIIRAGERIYGSGDISPTRGWISPTYGYKKPVLSFSVEGEGTLPFVFFSEWRFPVL
ncbi:MAG: alginate lyase family protein [Anaerolineales bacterium]|nr:alginate lyase family protein [Anaerolineales bacterium]